jgi:aminoglycoside phosphotransferase
MEDPVRSSARFDLSQIDRARVLLDIPGRLGTRIQHLQLPGGQRVYLKTAPHGGPEDLSIEHDRLRWLHGRLPVPEVLAFHMDGEDDLLLLSELPGTPAHRLDASLRAMALQVVVEALRRIHAVPVSDCPFRRTTQDEIAEARVMLARGAIDEQGFEAANGMSPAAGLARVVELEAALPELDIAWTHGDFCLPNVLVHEGRLGGILDWGLARVGDPARDLAMLEGSLRFNFGDAAVPELYAIWGAAPPRQRLEFFDLLDQFFTHVRVDFAPGSAPGHARETLP